MRYGLGVSLRFRPRAAGSWPCECAVSRDSARSELAQFRHGNARLWATLCGTVKSGDELLVISFSSLSSFNLYPSPPTAGTYTIVKPTTPPRAELTLSTSGSAVLSAPRLPFFMTDRASEANTEESRKNDTPSAAPESSTMTSPGSIASQEEQLRRYSKELYDYTMTLLNDAQAEEPQSKKNALLGKPNVLKRTVSDNTVPRTGDGIKD